MGIWIIVIISGIITFLVASLYFYVVLKKWWKKRKRCIPWKKIIITICVWLICLGVYLFFSPKEGIFLGIWFATPITLLTWEFEGPIKF